MPAPSFRPRHGQAETRPKPRPGPKTTPSVGIGCAGLTEVQWWAILLLVFGVVAFFAWIEAWFAAWIADLMKEGFRKWDGY